MMHRIFFAFIWIIGRVLLWIYRVDVKGLENLPKHSVLLCPNHSTDLDPVLIGLCLPLDYHLHFMAKAELFDNRALAWLIRTLGSAALLCTALPASSAKGWPAVSGCSAMNRPPWKTWAPRLV